MRGHLAARRFPSISVRISASTPSSSRRSLSGFRGSVLVLDPPPQAHRTTGMSSCRRSTDWLLHGRALSPAPAGTGEARPNFTGRRGLSALNAFLFLFWVLAFSRRHPPAGCWSHGASLTLCSSLPLSGPVGGLRLNYHRLRHITLDIVADFPIAGHIRG